VGLLRRAIFIARKTGCEEGELSEIKGIFVVRRILVKYAEQWKGRYLFLGRGEEKTGGRSKQAFAGRCAGKRSFGENIWMRSRLRTTTDNEVHGNRKRGEVSLKGRANRRLKTLAGILQARVRLAERMMCRQLKPDRITKNFYSGCRTRCKNRCPRNRIDQEGRRAGRRKKNRALAQNHPQEQDWAYDRTIFSKGSTARRIL